MGCCSSSPRSIRKSYTNPNNHPDISPSSYGEQECARVLFKLFPHHLFWKCRPPFLVNPKTKRCLELDLYNGELRLAIEFNGIQHYKYTKRFHRSRKDFEKQQERDIIKRKLCKKYGILLIVVPYDIENIETYIISKLKKHRKYSRYIGSRN